MYQADVLVERQRDISGGEFLWGQGAVTVEGAVLVQPLPINRRRRGAEMNREDTIDYLQEGLFGLARTSTVAP